jgi:protein TonB
VAPSAATDLTADQVDLIARLLPGSGRPAYPETLRNAGLGGTVDVQFVIDTTGRADMRSLTILHSTHPRFTEAVNRAIAKARFSPAEVAGRKVRQVVRMPFVFSIK